METEIILRLLFAVLWGGLVGMEREYHSKSAGFRTMIMISLGSAFFTTMSMKIGTPGSTDRIASNIVTGIGFLGAGVIFRGDNRINGITTAATIWAVAAVGMGIGSGHYISAACAAILILIVLALLPYIENIIDRLNQTKTYTTTTAFYPGVSGEIQKKIAGFGLRAKIESELKDERHITIRWSVRGVAERHRRLVQAMHRDRSMTRFEY